MNVTHLFIALSHLHMHIYKKEINTLKLKIKNENWNRKMKTRVGKRLLCKLVMPRVERTISEHKTAQKMLLDQSNHTKMIWQRMQWKVLQKKHGHNTIKNTLLFTIISFTSSRSSLYCSTFALR